MKKSLLLVFMAGMLSFSVSAKSEGPVVPSTDKAPKVEMFKLIKVTIQTTCGIDVVFDFLPAPGASQSSMEEVLGEEASAINEMVCDEWFDDWEFIWS